MIGRRVRGASSRCTPLQNYHDLIIAPRVRGVRCKATIGPELADALVEAQAALSSSSQIGLSIQATVDSLASAAPGPLQPLITMLGGDVAALAQLSPTMPGVARLSALYYMLLTRPSPLTGFLDYYVLGQLFKKTNNFGSRDFFLLDKLGGGNFGLAYEAVIIKPGETTTIRKELTQEQKRRRVVLKRVNMDKTPDRADFLKGGTMAKGATESGRVEAYMCDKISRSPLVSRCCAEFLGNFSTQETSGAFVKGSQWLVWKFESDSTLGDALDGLIGEFPYGLEPFVMGKTNESMAPEKRETLIIKSILKQVLVGVDRLHSIGIVHRDIKPENVIVTVDGSVKLIDFGAAVDMSTGINFNPLYGLLDPRYSPPEELVMPKSFPKAPVPFLSSLLAPFAWLYGRPDLFDSYSVGILLLQMSIPGLRAKGSGIRMLNNDLKQVDYDLELWRDTKGGKYDFTLLDRNKGAGWDLAKRLVCKRDERFRGRLSASEALRHRYFGLEF